MSRPAMGGPAAGAGFAERFDWLLANVAAVPGRPSRYSLEQAVAALAGPRAGDRERAVAHWWLQAMRAGVASVGEPESREYVAALERLFRLPPGYFSDEGVSRDVDDLITDARNAAERGITMIGPCRTVGLSARQRHLLLTRMLRLGRAGER